MGLGVTSATATQPVADLPRAADISVASVALSDPASANRVLGENIALAGGPFYTAQFLNSDRTEELTVILHPGAAKNAFAQFQVRRGVSSPSARALPEVRHFSSGKGVHLGMSETELRSIFGEPQQVDGKDGMRVLVYNLANLRESSFLQHYKMPSYSGQYTFRAGQLVEFLFGFPYP